MFSSDTVACSTMSALVMRLSSASYAARSSSSVGCLAALAAAAGLRARPRSCPCPRVLLRLLRAAHTATSSA